MGLNILIIDDSATTRQVIERTVRIADETISQCHHASNGREALKILEHAWVDIIFADLHMPEMDGREFLKRLREVELWKNIPVAVITSERSDETEVELLELGASFFHKKPLTPEILKEIFDSLKEKMP
jgi:two-component system chemotaxis response regulator CheY